MDVLLWRIHLVFREISLQTNKIIGWVGAAFFESYLQQQFESKVVIEDTTALLEKALFRLDQLTPGQIAAIVSEILARPNLRQYMDLKIPRVLVAGEVLPEEILIDDNAASVRNQNTEKLILLTVSSKNDIGDTLAHITIVSAKELRSNSQSWVNAWSQIGRAHV